MLYIHVHNLIFCFGDAEVWQYFKESWVAFTEHAKACVIDDYNFYIYHTAEQPVGLLFNCLHAFVGVTVDGQNNRTPDTFTPNEKLYIIFIIT